MREKIMRALLTIAVLLAGTPAYANGFWFFCSGSENGTFAKGPKIRSFTSTAYHRTLASEFDVHAQSIKDSTAFSSHVVNRYNAAAPSATCISVKDRSEAQAGIDRAIAHSRGLGIESIQTGWAP